MRKRYVHVTLLAATTLVAALIPSVVSASPAAADERGNPDKCAHMTEPEENHPSIRLRIDDPAKGAQVAVDEQGKITVSGIVHKQAAMLDVSDGPVTSTDFTLGPPPEGVPNWAQSWTTTLRPPNLGANQVCARAVREPHRSARVLRSFTAVDLIPPSAVPGLAVSDITATAAKVTWGAATDNYGLAGYAVTVDGGAAQRTTIATRSYTITGLTASTDHTVSVVAIDLAGNTSTPSTTSFTTTAQPPPNGDLTINPEQGAATAVWHPDPAIEVTYRVLLDGQPLGEFPPDRFCQDANGNPVSPCTAQDFISYPVGSLEENTPYTLQVDALRADGTVSRSLSGSFTTTVGEAVVPPSVTQQVASESSECAGRGGDFYVPPDARATVAIPAGSSPLFDGCYRVANNSCLHALLPPSGNRLVDCADDLTRLLFAVAPANHGPVLSSLDDVAGPVSAEVPGRVLIEPITWCIQDETCTVILTTAAEAYPLVLEAAEIATVVPAAAVSISWLVVIGGGIGLGLVLFSLYEILFPGHIGFNGILEYPISFDTNFDTFDNWYGDEGEWINSLKMFAEVIKTTDQVSSRYNIPFAWDRLTTAALKSIIDSACSVQRGTFPATAGCGDGFAVYVPGGQNYHFRPMSQTGAHIVAAMGGERGHPQPPQRNQWYYPAYSKGGRAATSPPNNYSHGWFDTAAFQPNACNPRPAGLPICDEFPFFSTNQAVNLSGVLADLQPVPKEEVSPQGSDLAQFYAQCKVQDTDRFVVLPVPPWVAANGPSFGFRVNQGGANLCLVPKQ